MRRQVSILFAVVAAGVVLAAAAEAPVRIPLCAGLTIVTAINEKDGRDYESIKRIESVAPDFVRLKYESDHPPATLDFASSRHTSAKRAMRQQDLESSPEYMQIFNPKLPDILPGTTAIGISRASLKDLKTKGETALVTYMMQAPPEDWPPHIKPDGIETAPTFNPKRTGVVKRVEASDVPVKVIVNDQPMELPAIHAAGDVGYTKHEIYVLDDPANPIALRYKFDADVLTVVKISFPPCGAEREADAPAGGGTPAGSGAGAAGSVGTTGGGGGAAPHIARALSETGHADVYGIYFDFDSDRIKDESEPMLQEIAGILEKNPGWKLEVNGHTDNIGGDPYNLDLSRRRAAAVKQALVSRYRIAATRLATNGLGASHPKAPNDTLEGRAQNRRVELIRR